MKASDEKDKYLGERKMSTMKIFEIIVGNGAIAPFFTMISKGFRYRGVKRRQYEHYECMQTDRSYTFTRSLTTYRLKTEMYKVNPYKVPDWAAHLSGIPTSYVQLSELNTPIHRWNIPSIPEEFQVYIKRDDLTGSELSGNKVRNLQIIFADALDNGCRHVVVGGSIQSGNCRAVALIARSLGLTPHIVIEGGKEVEDLGSKGNTLLYRMAGSQIYLAPPECYEDLVRRVAKMTEHISSRYGEPCYHIPVGGSRSNGLYGFLTMFQELMDQGLHERFDDVVVAMGTGLTAAGLAVGNYLTGSKIKVHGVSISLSKEILTEKIDFILREVGLDTVRTGDILDITTDHIGDGYCKVSDQALEYITQVSSTTGICLDPYYTGKCTHGMMTDLKHNPSRFNGKRILFVHTGGIFGLFNGEMDRVLDRDGAVTNNIRTWGDAEISPF